MPRQLKEIKNFNLGIVSNSDNREAPDDSALYSDNIDPNAPGGVIKAFKNDVLKGDTNYQNISSITTGIASSLYTKITLPTTHGLENGDIVKIIGTTNNDGTFTVSSKGLNFFDINDPYVATESSTGYWKKDVDDTYARLKYATGILVDMGGVVVTAGIKSIPVTHTDGLVIGDTIVIGNSMYEVEAIEGKRIITGGAQFGTLQESAPFADEAEVFKTSLPIAIESYIDVTIPDSLKENVILFDNSGRIDAIEDFTSSTDSSTDEVIIGGGMNSTVNSTDFFNFPMKINFNEEISIVRRGGDYFIGTGKGSPTLWLGKNTGDLLNSVDGFILQRSKLSSPEFGASKIFSKIITYQFTASNAQEVPIQRLANTTGTIHVACLEGTPFIYLIDGDTGKVHISQDLGFNVGTIAKVTSCLTAIKVWIYEADTEENGDFSDISASPGKVYCYEIFDLTETAMVEITNQDAFPIGFPLTLHHTIVVKWGEGGTSADTKGYNSIPTYAQEYQAEVYSGSAKISDMLETVDSSGDGKLWLLASPKEYDATRSLGWFRGSMWTEKRNTSSNFALFRFIWSGHTDTNGDLDNLSIFDMYFNDKSMPLHHIRDLRCSGGTTHEISVRQTTGNEEGLQHGIRFPKRTVLTADGTGFEANMGNDTDAYKDYAWDQWVYNDGQTPWLHSNVYNAGVAVHGGSYWYYNTDEYTAVDANWNPTTGNWSGHFWSQYDLTNVNMKLGGSFIEATPGGFGNGEYHQTNGYTSKFATNVNLGYHPYPEKLTFYPYPNTLVDVSDLYDGIDHVVTCAIGINKGQFLEDLWLNQYNGTLDGQSRYRKQLTNGFRITGCQDNIILWTTNAGPNNVGAMYVRSNSFGYEIPVSTDPQSDIARDEFTDECDTHSNTTVDNFGTSSDIEVGLRVLGNGIPEGAYVASITGGAGTVTAFTLSAAATSTLSGTILTFTDYLDLPQYDNINLSTLCYDKTEKVVRNIKRIEGSGTKEVLCMKRNNVFHPYNQMPDLDNLNDSNPVASGLFLSFKDVEESSKAMIFIKLNTIIEQGEGCIDYPDSSGQISQNLIDPALGYTRTGLAGYANNEGTVGSVTITDNTGAIDDEQIYPKNDDALLQIGGGAVVNCVPSAIATANQNLVDGFSITLENAISTASLNGASYGGEQISDVNDRTFAGAGANWTNAAGDNAFNGYDEEAAEVLTVSPDDDPSNRQYATLDGDNWEDADGDAPAMEIGRTYRLSYTLNVSSYTKGTLSIGTANDSYTLQDVNTYDSVGDKGTQTLDFVYDADCDKIIIDASTSSVFTAHFDNFSLKEKATSMSNPVLTASTGELLPEVLNKGPGALLAFTNNYSEDTSQTWLTDNVHQSPSTSDRTAPFLRKIKYSSLNPSDGAIRNVHIANGDGFVLRDNHPIFVGSENFQTISRWESRTIDGDLALETATTPRDNYFAGGGNITAIGFSHWNPVNLNPLTMTQNTVGDNIEEISSPYIVHIWPKGSPADEVGENADASTLSSRYEYMDYFFTLLNLSSKNKFYKGSIGQLLGPSNMVDEDRAKLDYHNIDDGTTQIVVIKHPLKESGSLAAYVEFTPLEEDDVSLPIGDENENANFPNDVLRRYKFSFEHDKIMEGPLSGSISFKPSEVLIGPDSELGDEGDPLYGEGVTAKSFKKMQLDIYLPTNIPLRASALVVYREGQPPNSDTSGESYYKVDELQFDAKEGWEIITIESREYYKISVVDKVADFGTYSSNNNDISQTLVGTDFDYGLSEEVNDYLFITHTAHQAIDKGDYTIIRSIRGKFSIFDYTNYAKVFSNRITALKGHNGKLFVFTAKGIHILNPDNLTEENYVDGFGCGNKDSVVSTEYGLFFCDKNHAYHYDGQSIKIISYNIETDLYSGKSNGWQDKITNSNVKVYFLSKLNSIVFLFKKTPLSSSSHGPSGAFIYHLLKRRWDYRDMTIQQGGLPRNVPSANELLFESELTGDIYYFAAPYTGFPLATTELTGLVAEFAKDAYDGSFSWVSKDMTMGSDTVDKRFIKLKLEASAALTTAPTVYIDDKAVTLTSSGTNEWKIRRDDATGGKQKGKKIRVEFSSSTPANENITIFSIGVIYRTTKIK